MLNLNNYPIIDKTHGAENVSSKYKTITTRKVIDHFMARGFTPTKIDIAGALKKENDGFQKHIVTFDCPTEFPLKVEGLQPKLHVLNSHNAKNSLKIFMGVYRLVCSNGLVVGTTFFKTRVLHVGNVEENLSRALRESTNAFDLVAEKINQWGSVELTREQATELARRAVELRLPKDNDTHIYSVDNFNLGLLTMPRRSEDTKEDLFTVFNVLQERLIQRPEVSTVRYNIRKLVCDTPVSKPRIELSSRRFGKLSAISKVKENAKLWDLTEKFYNEVA